MVNFGFIRLKIIMDKIKIEQIYQELSKVGIQLQSNLIEAQKKNGVIEHLFILLQNEINKNEHNEQNEQNKQEEVKP